MDDHTTEFGAHQDRLEKGAKDIGERVIEVKLTRQEAMRIVHERQTKATGVISTDPELAESLYAEIASILKAINELDKPKPVTKTTASKKAPAKKSTPKKDTTKKSNSKKQSPDK